MPLTGAVLYLHRGAGRFIYVGADVVPPGVIEANGGAAPEDGSFDAGYKMWSGDDLLLMSSSHDLRRSTDASLIHLNGDGAVGFAVVYERHVNDVYRWHLRHLRWAASDLTAETFARAWLSRTKFHDPGDGSALPWLLGIARNVLADSIRRDAVETRARVRLGLPLDLATDDGFEEVDRRLSPYLVLAEELDGLSAHERRALELRVVGELPYEEVAERLSIPPAAARLRVSRALRRLARSVPRRNRERPADPRKPCSLRLAIGRRNSA
jgi:RNA polymerase sigma factor (sigma-70 family)